MAGESRAQLTLDLTGGDILMALDSFSLIKSCFYLFYYLGLVWLSLAGNANVNQGIFKKKGSIQNL